MQESRTLHSNGIEKKENRSTQTEKNNIQERVPIL